VTWDVQKEIGGKIKMNKLCNNWIELQQQQQLPTQKRCDIRKDRKFFIFLRTRQILYSTLLFSFPTFFSDQQRSLFFLSLIFLTRLFVYLTTFSSFLSNFNSSLSLSSWIWFSLSCKVSPILSPHAFTYFTLSDFDSCFSLSLFPFSISHAYLLLLYGGKL